MDISHLSPDDQYAISRLQRVKSLPTDSEGGAALVESLNELLSALECSVSTQLEQPWYTLGQIKMVRDILELLTVPFDLDAVMAQFPPQPPQETR